MTERSISRRYDFSIVEAQWLSDLTGVASDLDAIVRICTRVEEDGKKFDEALTSTDVSWFEDRKFLADLASAAIVRYGRTFGTGIRAGIPSEWITSLSPELQSSHQYLKNLRDKSIAHSVSPLEDNQVWVWLVETHNESCIATHISVDSGSYLPGTTEARALLKLCQSLRPMVEAAIEGESQRLLALAQGMSQSEIVRRGSDELPIPSTKSVAKSRPRFKRYQP